MSIRRGDVVMAWFPFASGQGGKRRPCLIVQNDADNQSLANTVIAQITSNLQRVGDKSHLFLEVATPEAMNRFAISQAALPSSPRQAAVLPSWQKFRWLTQTHPYPQMLFPSRVTRGLELASSCEVLCRKSPY